jgi:quercetin 2,3-dioxygenase
VLSFLDPGIHQVRASGPFRVRRIHPGAHLATGDDRGFAGLGMIDHAHLAAGLTIPLHEHKDDEIVSYVRRGTLLHRDRTKTIHKVTPERLMVMNAGQGFSHEEHAPASDDVAMLQIFVRPEKAGLPPQIQFADLAAARATDGWRTLAGPPGSGAPTVVRQVVHLLDLHLPAGGRTELPLRPGFDLFLYVFSGTVRFGGRVMSPTWGATVTGPGRVGHVEAEEPADLVAVLVDPRAKATRAGTLSGRA